MTTPQPPTTLSATTGTPVSIPALAAGAPAVLERWEWLDALEEPSSGLSSSARAVAFVIARRGGTDPWAAWVPQSRIIAATALSKSTVVRAMACLEASGWLTRVSDPSQHRAARYALTTPRGVTVTPLAASDPATTTSLEDVRGATTTPLSIPQGCHGDTPEGSRGVMVTPLEAVDNRGQGCHGDTPEESRGVTVTLQRCHGDTRTEQEHNNYPSPYVGTSPARETGDQAPTVGGSPVAVATRSTEEDEGPRLGGEPTSPVVAAVASHRTTVGLKTSPALLAAPLIARGWTAAHVTRLLDALPADAGPGRAVKALRDAAATPPPATSTRRPARCPTHDRELTADGTCGLCRSERIAARATSTRVPVPA